MRGSLDNEEQRLYAGTEGKVPREESCESYGCALVTAHPHSPHLAERFHFSSSDWIVFLDSAAAVELAGIWRNPLEAE